MAPSIALKYFNRSEGNREALCKLCNKLITCRMRYSTGRCDTSNMLSHLKSCHPLEINVSSIPAPVNIKSELQGFFNKPSSGVVINTQHTNISPIANDSEQPGTSNSLNQVMPNLADEISLKVQDHKTKTSTDGSDRSSPIYDGASTENAVLKKQTTTRSVASVKRLNKKSTANKNKIGVALILSQKDNKTPQPTVKHIPEIGLDFVLRPLENKEVKLTITITTPSVENIKYQMYLANSNC